MRTMLTRLAVLLFLASGLLLLTVAGVEAQDKWSFVFTPQVWFENVRNNGFAAANNASGFSQFGGLQIIPSSALDSTGADPTSTFFPQWGGQFAAQRGPWTFGVSAQYLSFETSNTFTTTSALFPSSPGFGGLPTGTPIGFSAPFQGDKLYTEIINTDRTDVDATATYFFPDVIKDLLDVTTGLGFKWIRASGHRTLSDSNTGLLGASFRTFGTTPAQYILKKCGNLNSFASTFNGVPPGFAPKAPDDCLTNRASFLDQYYGGTIPTTLNFHLSQDGKWLLPLTMTPFLGFEGNNDQVLGWQTSFAYGGTFDVGVRYVFENGVAVYGGWRGQAIQGINMFFAQGPVFNMSVRFGGK